VITAYIVPGITLTSFIAALIAAVILGLVNAIVRPILVVLTLPITILSLGLFLLVINGISLVLVSSLTSGFTVSGFLPAVVGAIVLSLVSGILDRLAGQEQQID
jgi:putative membrane protein